MQLPPSENGTIPFEASFDMLKQVLSLATRIEHASSWESHDPTGKRIEGKADWTAQVTSHSSLFF